MQKDYDYYAFISCTLENEKWAQWLQKKFECCKLPAVFRKGNADLPKYIRPVFRDKTYGNSSPITAIQHEKLGRSQYLIVICSPEAAKSNWIGDEINAFVEMGRADRIIPFIVDGVANSNDSRECLHPLIKEKIPDAQGININEIGKQNAFLKTAAKILNLNLSESWQGRGHLPRRKRWLIAAIAGLLCLAGLFLVWRYYLPKKQFEEGYPNVKYKFDKQGNITEEACFDADGKPYFTEDGYSKATYKYDKRGNMTEEAYFGVNGELCLPDYKSYARVTYIYDEIGNKTEETRFDTDNKPLEESYAKKTYKYDARGNITEEAFFDADGKPYITKDGFSKITYKYDARGNITEEAFFDNDGKPCMAEFIYVKTEYKSYAKVTYKYDERGKLTETAYFDEDGKPYAFDNYVKVTYKYDNQGNMAEKAYFDEDGKPCMAETGPGFSFGFSFTKVTYKYNEQGEETESAYYDTNGDLTAFFGDRDNTWIMMNSERYYLWAN